MNFNNDSDKYFFEGRALSGKPIQYYSERIYQPTIDEIFDMGEEEFSKLIHPFMLSVKLFKSISKSDIPEGYDLFDILGAENYESRQEGKNSILDMVVIAISYFMRIKAEDIEIHNPRMESVNIVIKRNLIIDNFKFNELKDIILKLCGNLKEITEIKKDNEMKFKNEKDKAKFEKLFKGRKNNKALNKGERKVKLPNVYNTVVHMQDMIDYDRVLKMTLYQLYNTYSNLHIKENVRFTYDIASSGMVSGKDLDLTSFSDKIIK